MSAHLDPVLRPSGRVILLDAEGRILLFRAVDSKVDVPSLWVTPGGGLETGETYEEAALRELAEETGLREVVLGPCVWIRRHTWRWGERWIDSVEHFFVAHAPEGFVVRNDGLTANELLVIKEHRWWSAQQITESPNEVFVPRRLGDLLVPLASGQLPSAPLDPGV